MTLLLTPLAIATCAEPALPPPVPAAVTQEAPPPAKPDTVPSETAAADKAPLPSQASNAPPDRPAAPRAPEPPKSSGRTPVLKSDPEVITDSFGSSPAKLEIGESQKATLRIPEEALSGAVNLTFKIDKKGKSNGPPIGKIYRITPVIPPAGEPTKVETTGPAFELALPAGDRKDANLAIGELDIDDNGRPKIVWTVIAPLRIDDVTATAHFELRSLSDAYLHITTKPATPSAPAP